MVKEFIELNQDTGEYNDVVQVTCSPHTGLENRECVITGTTSGGTEDTMTVIQQAKEAFIELETYNGDNEIVGASGGSFTVKGKANVPSIKITPEIINISGGPDIDIISFSAMTVNGSAQIVQGSDNTFSIGPDYGSEQEYEFSVNVVFGENRTTGNSSYILKFSYNGVDMDSTCEFELQAGQKSYSDIVISEFTYPMIPASGGSVYPTLGYSQTWGWNGNTTNGGTVSSGADISYAVSSGGTSVSGETHADSKGTVISDVTGIATVTVTVSMNSKTATAEAPVQQEKNIPVKIISASLNSYLIEDTLSFEASGGTKSGITPSRYSVEIEVSSGDSLTVRNDGTPSGIDNDIITSLTENTEELPYGVTYSMTSDELTAVSLGTSLFEETGGSISWTATLSIAPAKGYESLFSTITSTADYSYIIVREANTRKTVYGKPVVSDISVADIPASGGTVSEADFSYSQTRHYLYTSGSTESLSAITSGASVNYGTPVTASSRGTVVGTRKLAGTLTFTVSLNGQSSTEQEVSVYQQANSVSYGNVSLTVETPVNCDVLGGQYKITPTASQVLTYTSTATASGSITINYTEVSPLSGFSLSGQYVNVTENESTVARNGYQVTVLATGAGSKTASKTVVFNQAAGVKSYGPVNITSFYYSQIPASGGVATPVLAYSQTWGWNDDTTSGGTITTGAAVSYSGTGVASSGSVSVPSKGTSVSGVTNYTLVTVKVTLNNIAATTTAYVTQAANAAVSITYGTPSVKLTSVPDIPASGGSVSSGTMTYSQSRTQNYTSGSTSALSALTSGGSVSYSTVSASSLGTKVKSRTNVGTLTCTVTMNGKSGSDTCAVYQAANAVVSSEEGNYSTLISANRYTTFSSPCPASGGTATLSWSASYQTRNKYTSGSYDSWVTHAATPGITGSGTGFSRSGSTVTASNRGTTVGSLRSATYSASYGTSTTSVTIYQQANSQNNAGITYGTWSVSVVANRYTSANSPCPASGGTCTITRSATRTRVQNYSYTSGATSTASMTNETGTPTLSISGTGASLSGTTVTWASRGTTTGAARSATVTANMSGVTATENVYQERNGGDVAKDYVFSVSPSTATVAASATSYTFTVISTYTLQYTSGAEQTGLNTAYDVSTTSSWITANTNKVTFSQNTGTSRRSGKVDFTQINSEKTTYAWLYQNAPVTNVQLNITTQGNSSWSATGTFKLTTQKATYSSEHVRLSGDSGGSASIRINELNPNIGQITFEYSGTLETYSGTISIGSSQYSSNYGQIYLSPGVWTCQVNILNPSTIWINFNIY